VISSILVKLIWKSNQYPGFWYMNQDVSKKLKPSLTRSDLIKVLSKNQRDLASKDVELAVKSLINLMSDSLSSGERIEIRGFGSFNLQYHQPRSGRNPRTGEPVRIQGKHVPHFKAAKELRKRVL
jgi:integration host factor subunit beta